MKNFSNLNDLPAEVKMLIVNGQTLIEQTKKTLEDYSLDFDLTSKSIFISPSSFIVTDFKIFHTYHSVTNSYDII